MYDALLDDLEDDSTPNHEEASELAEKPTGDLDLDDELDVADLGDSDAELDPKAEDLLAVADEEGESWSDDPVRMYLTQMGEIPLLTRRKKSPWPSESKLLAPGFAPGCSSATT